jgi:predicted metalloprotease with PDZ domain
MFDLTIRAKTDGSKSLDDVMRALWLRYGRDFYAHAARGVTEAEVEALFDRSAASNSKRCSTATCAAPTTCRWPGCMRRSASSWRRAQDARASLDVATGRDGADSKLTQVHEGGAAHRAGLSAGDVLVALDGLRVTGNPSNLDTLLGRYRVGDTIEIHAFRRDELMTFSAKLLGDRSPAISLDLTAGGKQHKRPSA